MPYTGPSDVNLPDAVKKLSAVKRRKWVAIFNKTFANCRSPSIGAAGSIKKCETAAFRFANGAVKEMGDMDEDEGREDAVVMEPYPTGPVPGEPESECTHAEGEKCSACGPTVVEVAPAPLAGAITFDEADHYDEAQEVESYAYRLEHRFSSIVDNIFASDASLAEKASRVKAAAAEMEERLGKPPESGNWFGKAKERLGEVLGLGEKATKREDGKDFPAKDYAYVPDATKPSTWKLRLTKTPGGTPNAGIVGAAIAALGKGFRGQKVQIPAADLPAVKAKVRAAWRKANPDKKTEDMPAAIKEAAGAFRAFKDADGNWRWMTLTSNMFRDRDGEIIPAAAHEENVAYVERTKEMPELRLWHVPGSRVGVADWIDYAHGFLLHSGGFDKGMEHVAESLVASEKPLGMSHGFYYEKDDGSDIYRSYRDFEVSVLPLEVAANQWTEFNAENAKEVVMGLTDERRGFLVEHMSEDQVTALEKLLEEKEQDLKDGNVDFKEVLADAFEVAPEPAPAPPAPAPAPAATGQVVAPATNATAAPAPAAALAAEGAKPEGEEEDPAALTNQVAEGVKALNAGMEKLTETVETLAGKVTELERTDEEKLAAKSTPRAGKVFGQERPTGNKGNVVEEEAAKETVGDGEPAPGPAHPYVEDLIRSGAPGATNLPPVPAPVPGTNDGK